MPRSDGTIYFTDPTYGIDGTNGPAGTQELGYMGVFRLTPDGALYLEDATNDSPNGASLSPDERTLYVSYTSTSQVAAFDVTPMDRSPTSECSREVSRFRTARPSTAAVTSRGGAARDRRDRSRGALLGTIALPQWPSNCAFGGPDQKTLFITARNLGTGAARGGALYRIDSMPIAGVPGQP